MGEVHERKEENGLKKKKVKGWRSKEDGTEKGVERGRRRGRMRGSKNSWRTKLCQDDQGGSCFWEWNTTSPGAD